MMIGILLCSMWALTTHAVNRPPHIYMFPSSGDVYYKPGESTELVCIAEGVPKPQYFWRVNGEAFDPSGQDNRVVQLPNEGTIVFNSTEDKDEGFYQCFADNGYGISVSATIHFVAAKLRKFAYEPRTTHTVTPGKDLTLPCPIPWSSYPVDVYWVYKESDGRWQAIEYDKRVSMDIQGRLRFTNVKKNDEISGKAYSCMVINYVLGENTTGPEHVVEVQDITEQKSPARELWTSPSGQFFVKGDLLRLMCIFAGNPTPDVSWQRIDGVFPERASFERSGQQLHIKSVQLSDAGQYECMGLNTESIQPATKRFDIRIESAPYWVDEPMSVEASIGEKATFLCRASGTPAYAWFINGIPLEDRRYEQGVRDPRIYQNRRFFKPNENNITLTNLTLEDHMNIQCNASNKHGYVFSDVYLNVNILAAPYWVDEPLNVEASIGESATFICRASGYPEPKYSWFINGKPLEDGGNVTSVRDPSIYQNNRLFKPNDNNVTLTNLTLEDHMNIRCNASNKVGYVLSDVYLNILAAPYWVDEPVSVEARTGESATFICRASGYPEPTYSWFINGNPLEDRGNISGVRDPRIYQNNRFSKPNDNNITLTNLTLDDHLHIQCNASNKVGYVFSDVSLEVFAAPYWVDEPVSVEARTGESATFICRASGYPEPTYSWFINGNPLEDRGNVSGVRDPRIYQNNRFSKPNNNNITLTNLTFDDHMNIQCNASNKVGYVFSDVSLKVFGVSTSSGNSFLMNTLFVWTSSILIYVTAKA